MGKQGGEEGLHGVLCSMTSGVCSIRLEIGGMEPQTWGDQQSLGQRGLPSSHHVRWGLS
jgi:hypothetical protein